MSDPNKNRIAIKFGSSTSSKPSSRPKPPSTLGKRPRSHAWGDGSDDNDSDNEHRGRSEAITGFGAEGAETEKHGANGRREEQPKEYRIERQPNRDWKTEARARRRQTNPLPAEARAQQDATTVETEPADQDTGLQWGLTVTERTTEPEQQPDSPAQAADQDPTPLSAEPEEPRPQRTADDDAMDALLGRAPERDLAVIQPSEEDAFRRDVRNAGEASTLADYEAMPVEEFGAALLRGMGWNGEPRGPKVKEVKRRPNRLGLGAKELKESEDLGGWNQNGKKRSRPRLDEYRREEAKKRDGRLHEDSYKRERERERDAGRNRDRHGDRDRDYDRHRDRRRDHDRDRRR